MLFSCLCKNRNKMMIGEISMRKMKKIVTGIAVATLLLGSMLTVNAATSGWLQEGNTWYYLDGNGIMKTGWQQVSGKWYYLSSNGAMKTGWLQDGRTWYYLDGSGVMKTGWQQISGKWYYLSSNGAMKTGWLQEGSTWYYLNSDGTMKTGWLQEGNKWYYLNANGSMAVNTTIDNCYVGADGSWTDSSSSSTMKEGLRPELAAEFLKLWNEERRALGLKEVKITEWAQKYADIRAEQLTREFSHRPLDGLANYGGEYIGNVGAPDMNRALDGFKNSEAHWAGLTDRNITECGVAVYYKNGNTYVTVNTNVWLEEWGEVKAEGFMWALDPDAFEAITGYK